MVSLSVFNVCTSSIRVIAFDSLKFRWPIVSMNDLFGFSFFRLRQSNFIILCFQSNHSYLFAICLTTSFFRSSCLNLSKFELKACLELFFPYKIVVWRNEDEINKPFKLFSIVFLSFRTTWICSFRLRVFYRASSRSYFICCNSKFCIWNIFSLFSLREYTNL